MKIKYLFVLVTCSFLSSCSKSSTVDTDHSVASDSAQAENEFDYDKLFLLESYLADGNFSENELQTIDSTCAIFVFPTEEQLENLKKTEGEDNFETILDDGNFYQAAAMNLIDSLGFKTITAKGRYLMIKGQQTWALDVRRKNLPEWNLIFFQVDKAPIIVPTAGLGPEKILEYFQISK